MRLNTPIGRVVMVLLALLLAVAVATVWRQSQQRQMRAQQTRELELMKKGAIEFNKGVGSPTKAIEQTGDPFSARQKTQDTSRPEKRP